MTVWWKRLAGKSDLFAPRQVVELGEAWAGNSVNCVPFRIDGVRTQGDARYATYYDAAGDVVVIRQELSDGSLQRVVLANPRKPHDAHQAISLGLDARGYLHLAFGAHCSTFLRTCSRSSSLDDGFEELVQRNTDATYPMFLALPDGELVFMFRRGRHFEGEICLERLVLGASTWVENRIALVSGLGSPWTAGPYLNTPIVGKDGAVYFFVVWRIQESASSEGSVVNVGIDCIVSRDRLHSLTTLSGVRLPAPVTPLTSERVIAVPVGASLINQAAAALLPGNKPAVIAYWDAGDGVPQYRLGWQDGSGWRTATLSRFTTSFRLDGTGTLPLPHSRPELLTHEDGRVIVVFRSVEMGNRLMAAEFKSPDYNLSTARQQVLVDEDLGFYEPIVDRAAWYQRHELVLYVQRCEQGRDGDGKLDLASSSARLMSWTQL